MRVVDTSAWIEWLIGSPTGDAVADLLPTSEAWLVPSIVQLELAKWLTREVGEAKADQVIAFTRTCIVVPLDADLAIAAADVARCHRLSTADAIVYATAQRFGTDLLTCDHHFDTLPGAIVLPKRATG